MLTYFSQTHMGDYLIQNPNQLLTELLTSTAGVERR